MNDHQHADEEAARHARARLLARLPTALIALSGACTLSVAIAFVSVAAGRGVPPLAFLAVPPALTALGAAAWLTRGGRGDGAP
jgi:acyl dehydratase